MLNRKRHTRLWACAGAVSLCVCVLGACGCMGCGGDSARRGCEGSSGCSLVFIVARGEMTDIAEAVDRGSKINCVLPRMGIGPLAMAARMGRRDIVEYLLTRGADPNVGDPLRWVAVDGQVDMAKLLIAAGSDVNARVSRGGVSLALMEAVQRRNAELVALYIEEGGNVNAGGGDDCVLRAAVVRGYPNIVRLLLARGARTDWRDSDGKSAEDLARDRGFDEILSLLRGN
ncbi:MAG: hypothetical protein BIFFINMI_02272 [Phycisphaerae bacterium]|nr:hypothetical protein [Phycisphaerae bacterium]